MVGGNRDRSETLADIGGGDLLIIRGWRREEVDVRLVDRLSVYVHLFIPQLDGLAGQSDDAFDEVALRLVRVLEHDDIAAVNRTDGQHRAADGQRRRAEDELVDEQMIADQEVVLHRPRRNLEGLHDPRAHKERQDHGDHDRLEVFADDRFLERIRAHLDGSRLKA